MSDKIWNDACAESRNVSLRNLVEKWRKEEKETAIDLCDQYYNNAIGACADELEKLLNGGE